MTTSPPATTESSPAEVRPASARFRSDIWKLSLLISLNSLLVSIYSIGLADRLTPAATQADIDQTASELAGDLSELAVSHRRFGKVGLVDLAGADGESDQLGLNNLNATLRLDYQIASDYNLDYMRKLIETDSKDCAWIGSELARIEREQISAPFEKEAAGKMYEHAKRLLTKNWRAGQLVDIRIKLGRMRSAPGSFSSTKIPFVSAYLADSQSLSENGFYKANIPVPIAGDNKYSFMSLPEESKFLPVGRFEPVTGNEPAGVLLLEAEFLETNDRPLNGNGKPRHRIMRSCVAIGSPLPKANSSVFMLSFPHGFFTNFPSVSKLFSQSDWLQSGETYEAYSGPIPGRGRLIPTTIANAKLSPAEASIMAFYHFLFSLGPEVKKERVGEILTASLDSTRSANSTPSEIDESNYYNSAMLRYTDAAKFALLKQSSEGGIGQETIVSGFSSKQFQRQVPVSAFPLDVSPSGSVRFINGSEFDEGLVHSFFDAIYETNISGIESMQIAGTVIERTQMALRKCSNDIQSYKEEKKSLEQSIASLEGQDQSDAEEKLPQLKDRAIVLQVEMDEQTERKKHFEQILENSKKVYQNAKNVAKTSYDIATHMSKFVNQGLQKIDSGKSFLLNNSVVFTPINKPIEEEEIYEMTERPEDDSGRSKWTSDNLTVSNAANGDLSKVPFRNRKELMNSPIFFLISSKSLLSDEQARLLSLNSSPFAGSGIKQSQFCYFAQSCAQSAATPGVKLSILIRDLQAARQNFDQNIYSTNGRWCMDLGLEGEKCPGLAGEIQVRTPIPNLKQLPNRYLKNPNDDEQAPLIPALPAEML